MFETLYQSGKGVWQEELDDKVDIRDVDTHPGTLGSHKDIDNTCLEVLHDFSLAVFVMKRVSKADLGVELLQYLVPKVLSNVEQVEYCSFPFALLLPYVAVSPLSHSPCHAPYAPDSTIMRYHASI
jgi:hypothetical protein